MDNQHIRVLATSQVFRGLVIREGFPLYQVCNIIRAVGIAGLVIGTARKITLLVELLVRDSDLGALRPRA